MLAAIAAVALVLLGVSFCRQYGSVRGTLATVSRGIWISPVFAALFPLISSEELPRSAIAKPINVLIDDSSSMEKTDPSSKISRLNRARVLVDRLGATCSKIGCFIKSTTLSSLDHQTNNNFTPLSSVITTWLGKSASDPWVIISDGGDWRPRIDWSPSLINAARNSSTDGMGPRGVLISLSESEDNNIWIDEYDVPPLAFEGKTFDVHVALKRSFPTIETNRVQVQVVSGDEILATSNAEFVNQELKASVTTTLKPMTRGAHLLEIRALPVAGEQAIWDNTVYVTSQVFPNTVGVLHLLGSPSWDGRFMRRHLKSEPKFDLISFFILRDPWDSQLVTERELSLIPFPVDRLFREELGNFKVLIVQDFSLYQFLLPEYQEDLVSFVRKGGALLFIGGPRALHSADVNSSPLRSILPFKISAEADHNERADQPLPFSYGSRAIDDDRGPTFDAELAFRIKLANPDSQHRLLVTLYDEWKLLEQSFSSLKGLQGIHRMNKVSLTKDAVPLLLAETKSGKDIPLAVASCPDKGRSVWIFSDQFWKLALNGSPETPRESYDRFIESTMTWLLGEEIQKPLVVRNFLVHDDGPNTSWQGDIEGVAARYIGNTQQWKLRVCSLNVSMSDVLFERTGTNRVTLSGSLPTHLASDERCSMEIEAQDRAFGSIKAEAITVNPAVLKDNEIPESAQKMARLAKLTGAKLIQGSEPIEPILTSWVESMVGKTSSVLPKRFKTSMDYFWILHRAWYWLLLLFLPVEVIVRRWPELK